MLKLLYRVEDTFDGLFSSVLYELTTVWLLVAVTEFYKYEIC